MTMRQKKGIAGLTVTIASGILALVTGVVVARSGSETLRIELVIEDMTFRGVDPADRSAVLLNPTLHLHAGQPVEIVLRSLDPGMKHDLVIPDLKLHADAVQNGETATLRFTVPAPGSYPYFCSMHPKLMRGELVVSP